MPPNPPIHYRRIPGTRRYYNPLNPSDRLSERQVTNYRSSLTEDQRKEVRAEARRVATWRSNHEDNLASIYQRKLESQGETYDAGDKARFSELYARLQQIHLEEQTMLGLPEYGDDLRALRAAGGEYAEILEELGRRPADADYDVGQSPQGTVAAMWG